MRILHLSNHCIFGNGNVHAAVDLACEQARQGHSVYFASGGGDFEPLLVQNGVTHVRVHQAGSNPIRLISSVLTLTRLIAKSRLEIIHAHMMSGAILGWIATRLTRTALITTVHNAFDKHAILMGLGDRVIAVSNAVATTMTRRGIKNEKIVAILNGTLGTARNTRPKERAPELPRPSVTTVCGLHDRKGVRHLLEAFETVADIHKGVHLNIIGEGPQEEEYQSIASKLRCSSRIRFWGQLRDPRPFLSATDIFVLASLQDPCPLVIPEAREMGCAIVATDVDGIPEMLNIGNAGVLVPPANSEAISIALSRLLANNAELERQKTASIAGIEYFAISRVCAQTTELYSSVL